MNRTAVCVIALVVTFGALAAPSASAQETLRKGLENCASIRNAAERLFCFDSLAAGTDVGKSVAPATGAGAAQPAASGSQPVASARPPMQPATEPASDDKNFGRELAQAREGPESISSRYDGTFNGWTGDTVFQLENGQVWKQVESHRLSVKKERPMMNIRRGWFGAYYLKVEGSNKQIRVKRIK